MTNNIILEPLSKENWEQCANLQVSDSQKENLPTNLHSIAELQFYPQTKAFAIKDDSDLVGFLTCGIPEDYSAPKIFRFMIEKKFQRQGYGAAALKKVVKMLFDESNADEVQVCYHPNKDELKRFYGSVGFKEREILPTPRRSEGKMLATVRRENFVG